MPIGPFLKGERFDPETRRVLSVALEMVCVTLRPGDCDDFKRTIATKLVALVKAGERNPDILREQVLRDICENLHRTTEPASGQPPFSSLRPRAHVGVFACRRAAVDPKQRAACEPDAMRLCNQYIPDVQRVSVCMSAYRRYLSPACRAVFYDSQRKKLRRR
jgi:hypothetical protein